MLKESFLPKKEVAHIVKSFWTLSTPVGMSATMKKFRYLPDGCPELIFHYGASPKLHFGGTEATFSLPGCLMGNFRRYADAQVSAAGYSVLAKLHPWVLGKLIGDSASMVTDFQLEFGDFFRADVGVYQQILDANSPAKAIPIIENWLLGKLGAYEPDLQLARAVEIIGIRSGNISIQDLEHQLNIGIRRLEQKFADEIGIGVKYYARIVRIRAVAEAIRVNPTTRLADIAYDHGFFDQAHFIREFRHFSDMSPKAYARAIRGKASLYQMELPEKSPSEQFD
jgi:AraC-like DNA-binding protein